MTTQSRTGSERRQYRNPPIREAVCDVKFVGASEELDLALPGRMVENLPIYGGGTYRLRPILDDERADGLEPSPRIGIRASDGSRALSFAAGHLTAHMFTPYQGWEAFADQVEQALITYSKIVDPGPVERVAVHYLNQIVIPETMFDTSDYFSIAVTAGGGIPEAYMAMSTRVRYFVDEDTEFELLFETDGSTDDEDAAVFVLDLAVRRFFNVPIAVTSDVMRQIADVRDLEREYFEALITDRLRGMFDA